MIASAFSASSSLGQPEGWRAQVAVCNDSREFTVSVNYVDRSQSTARD